MPVIADTHVHIYPCYDIAAVVRNAMRNLDGLALDSQSATGAREDWQRVLFLTERHDCHAFREFCEKGIEIRDLEGHSRRTNDEQAIAVDVLGSGTVYLVAGRQIVTRERLEISALTVDIDIPDGLPAADVIRQIENANGIPVLSWAPGKWFFSRGRVARSLIEKATPGRLIIGDTTLRPTIWKEPRLMHRARQRGLGLIAGSDPLPFAGEEHYVGTYGVVFEGSFDEDRPVRSLRRMLCAPSAPFIIVGQRGDLGEVIARLRKNRALKKARG